ncbi:hypothetical protein FC18_GL001283 [Lacticaseibacillus sharpeae JCM 1186 = DSM 20505]|uniref:Uncharacterized protein n=1 Tax=Lacticaseibacillus sharpeae JCM 1186 = DSM 20505 TaxID=1291052 RepID=A0A0R1ZUP2_9LACO|nr:hypothetical protein FC18_GL001283 [Lacticaseibacillus sharpeae JCM 1186 = DSM 20505]
MTVADFDIGFVVDVQQQAQAAVQAWGLVPADNYLIVQRQSLSRAANLVDAVTHTNPDMYDDQYLLAASFDGLILKRIIRGKLDDGPNVDKRVLNRAALTDVRIEHADAEYRLGFTVDGAPELYYLRDDQPERLQYCVRNAAHLLENNLYGMANLAAAQADRPERLNTPTKTAGATTEYVPDEYRPERKPGGIFARKPHATQKQDYPEAHDKHWVLHALVTKGGGWRSHLLSVSVVIVILIGIFGFGAVGRHTLNGTVTNIELNEGKRNSDIEITFEQDNGKSITVENSMNPFLWKWGTNAIQKQLHVGAHYHVQVAGPMNNGFSAYNIIAVTRN